MDLGLENKHALVTAGSKGMGKAIAKLLVKEGAKVMICSRSISNLRAAREEIKHEIGVDIDTVRCDLRKKGDVAHLIDQVRRKYKGVDIFVSNTGGPKPGSILSLSENDWHQTIELVLMSAIRLTKAFLPYMKKKNWGRIVYMTSSSVKEPIDNLLLSNVLRAGVNAFSKTLSREFAKNNVLFNVVCPGGVYTSRAINLIKKSAEETGLGFEEIKKRSQESIPLGRYGSPEEIAYVVVFLCSNLATYVTGDAIQIDGGAIRSIL